MGIMERRGALGLPQHTLAATPQTGPGVVVAAHATLHTKGNYVELIASTNYEVYGLSMLFLASTTAVAATQHLLDIAIGGAGSEVVIASNLFCCSGTGSDPWNTLFLPLCIPKSTRISARCQSNVTVKSVLVTCFVHGGGEAPWQTFSRCEGIGVDTATSGGLIHTPGNTGAESTWTNIGSTLAREYFAMLPMVQSGSDTTMNSLGYHVEMGINSVTLGEWYAKSSSNEFIAGVWPPIPQYGRYPLGTQMMIRAECSGTAEVLQFGLLGFY